MNKNDVLSKIDSTCLKPDATRQTITKLCTDAERYGFAAVCVHPCNVRLCCDLLKGKIAVATVIGFPMGANTPAVKAIEAGQAVADGADEIDMVINIGAAKEGRWDFVRNEIAGVVKASGTCVKVIIETCFLTPDEIVYACSAAMEAGAKYVKTSTGYGTGGATVEDVKLMAETVEGKGLVKASGGIRTYDDCIKYIRAGASRIGTGSGAAIAAEAEAKC